MIRHTVQAFRRAALALGFVCLAPGAAHAGLVTGEWDPQFGPFLPGLSWQVRANLLVPNGCSNQSDGIYNTGDCAQANINVLDVWLRLYDTGFADPNDFFTVVGGNTPDVDPVRSTYWTFGGGFNVTNVRVEAQQVVGFDMAVPSPAQTVVVYLGDDYSYPSSAGGNLFGLSFGFNGPVLECFSCRQVINDPFGGDSVFASTTDLNQFLVTYTSEDTSQPKFMDANGNALGARLDSNGVYLGQSTWAGGPVVPEPGALALVLTALAALGVARHRRG